MKVTRWSGESTRNLLQEEPELGYTKNPERMTLNLVIIVFWHVGFVHPIPDGFCADKKTTLDWVSCYTQERWFWRAFCNGAKLRRDYRVFSLSWPASMQIYWNKRKRLQKKKKSTTARGLVWDTNMAAVSWFWDTNMAAVTSCENTPYVLHVSDSFCATLWTGILTVAVVKRRIEDWNPLRRKKIFRSEDLD